MPDLFQPKTADSLQWFNDLYQQYVSHVYRIALHMIQDPAEAEDLCHDVFLEVIQRPEQFNPDRGSLKAWLAVKTRSRAIDRLRRQRRQRRIDHMPEPAGIASFDPTAESVLIKMANESLHESLRRLPESQHEALAATYFQSLRQKEWAELNGYPLGTVKSLVRYGINNIRKYFLKMGWMEP